jgi:hypothetical protein
VVLGLELSGAWANAKDTSDCAVSHINIGSNLSCSAKQDWSAQLLARFRFTHRAMGASFRISWAASAWPN